MKSQERLRSENHNVFSEEVNKIALSAGNDKRPQSIDSIETCAYGTNIDLASEKEEIQTMLT